MSSITDSASAAPPLAQEGIHTPNLMQKIIGWVRDPDVPTLYKVGMVALVAFTSLAIGYLFGKALLCLALTTSVALLWAAKELLEEPEHEAPVLDPSQAAQRALRAEHELATGRVQDLFGGAEAFQQLPELDFNALLLRTLRAGYIDFATPWEVEWLEPRGVESLEMGGNFPIMRGTDPHGGPFVALKVRKKNEDTRPRNLVLYQLHSSSQWLFLSEVNLLEENILEENILGNSRAGELTQERLDLLSQILSGAHPIYEVRRD